MEKQYAKYGYMFITPFFLVFIVFSLYPIFYTLFLSFHTYNGFTDMIPVGFLNYSRVFNDKIFYEAFFNTVRIWGGTYLNIRKGSGDEDIAYDFLSSMLFDTERMTERAANGDVYARKSVMDTIMADYEGNDVLGGMNHYETFLDEAAKISFDNVTKYDRQLDTLFGKYANGYKRGEYETLSDAFNGFYDELQTAFNEIYRDSGLPYQD
ncbi:MAG: hypothetical protein K9L74_05995 [Candidatus Izimaplasma sp.]|nr:hypothetical protein [Candidatus Izimaplasma bacterium]